MSNEPYSDLPTESANRVQRPQRRISAAELAFLALAGWQVWAYFDGHAAKTTMSRACPYFQHCKVCLDVAGFDVCEERTDVDPAVGVRRAWLAACLKAAPASVKSELDVLDRMMSESPHLPSLKLIEMPCRVMEQGPSLAPKFLTAPELRCVKVLTELMSSPKFREGAASLGAPTENAKDMEEIERSAAKYEKVMTEIHAAQAKWWNTCLALYPRTEMHCTPASDRHYFRGLMPTEAMAGPPIPDEVD